MSAILNFKMAAKDSKLKIVPLHLLTPKTYIYTQKSCFYVI